MRRVIVAVIGVVGLSWAGACWGGVTDLTSVPKYLPYRAESSNAAGICQTGSIFRGQAIELLDIDHDGTLDLIYSTTEYLAAKANPDLGEVLYYQTNYPPEYETEKARHCSPQLRLCGDLDGDGLTDLVILGSTRDGKGRWLWIADPYTGQVKHKYTLPVGRDVRADGRWDGEYFVVGAMDVRRGTEDVRALIIGCCVGYDKYGRGVLALDPNDGSVLWRYQCGPNPYPWNMRIADLDGDGQSEIIFVGRSPDNLGGEEINGFSDDQTRLFVLDRQGQVRWSRYMCDSYGNGEMDLGDLDGDGKLEIVTTAHTTPEVWGEIAIWDGEGQKLASLSGDQQYRGVRLLAHTDQSSPSLLVATNSYRLQEFAYRAGSLQLERSAQFANLCHINLIADFLPPDGQEIVVTANQGATFVLDENLDALLACSGLAPAWGSEARIWPLSAGERALLWPSVYAPAMAITKAPFAWPRLRPYGLGALAVAVAALIWWYRRRPAQVDPQLLHETRLNLLNNLELSNHGAIAPLKCVRRLIWHLRALQTDLGNNPNVEIRMREAWTECRESALPHLRGIVDRARLAGSGNGYLETIVTNIAIIDKQLESLARKKFQVASDPDLADELEKAEQEADSALIRLRGEVATYFRTDIARTVARVQRARALDLSQAGVNFQAGRAASAAGGSGNDSVPMESANAIALCDPRELEFVLDNLVGNAFAAMKNASPRNLNVTWRTTDGMVVIDVSDTGCGMAEEVWDRALNSRYSSKPSGGKGLPQSREYLRKYGGGLSILRSAPGRGSTFRVTLPVN